MVETKQRSGSGFSSEAVRSITYDLRFTINDFFSAQMLEGLAFIHRSGFFHRDMKPENILIAAMPRDANFVNSASTLCFKFTHHVKDETVQIKIADFGLARELRSLPPYTAYVSTRWYRAPELLLQTTNYSSPIDMWAAGCILYELCALTPLFPGTSDLDQLYRQCTVLGTPNTTSMTPQGGGPWPDAATLASKSGINFPHCVPTPLASLLPSANPQAIRLVQQLICWDPSSRLTATKALEHAFIRTMTSVNAAYGAPAPLPFNMAAKQINTEAPATWLNRAASNKNLSMMAMGVKSSNSSISAPQRVPQPFDFKPMPMKSGQQPPQWHQPSVPTPVRGLATPQTKPINLVKESLNATLNTRSDAPSSFSKPTAATTTTMPRAPAPMQKSPLGPSKTNTVFDDDLSSFLAQLSADIDKPVSARKRPLPKQSDPTSADYTTTSPSNKPAPLPFLFDKKSTAVSPVAQVQTQTAPRAAPAWLQSSQSPAAIKTSPTPTDSPEKQKRAFLPSWLRRSGATPG
jgi:serine/threonine protein kinase